LTAYHDRITLSVAEAEVLTGLSHKVLYRLMNQGRLPSLKVGRRRLIRRDDLDALLAAGTAIPGSEVAS
jgi:excisionase family DNA binding protein